MWKYGRQTVAVLLLALLLCPIVTRPAQAQEGRSAYTVQPGDTIWSVAREKSLDAGLLAAMNNMTLDQPIISQAIWLPLEPNEEVTVEPGDTLWDIAHRYQVSVTDLAADNQLADPTFLRIGQTLTVPCLAQEEQALPQVAVATAARPAAASRSSLQLLWPVQGTITSHFGNRSRGFHHGLDIAAESGTTIRACLGGEVTFAGYRNSIYGNAVTLDHGNGCTTVYGHASKVLVEKGQQVEAGQAIALVGATGNATGPHVHLELHFNDEVADPLSYLR